MISYSRKEMERQLIADQAFWRRVPASAAALLWPGEVALLGWDTGWWVGLVTAVLLGAACTLVPPRLRMSIYLIDLLERLLKLPLQLGWLLMVWHLGMREPVFAPLGQPLVGALAATAALWLLTRLLTFATRLGTRRLARHE